MLPQEALRLGENRIRLKGTIISKRRYWIDFTPSYDFRKSNGEGHNPSEEFPVAAWAGTDLGDPSTPRYGVPRVRNFRGAAVGMTALIIFERDGTSRVTR